MLKGVNRASSSLQVSSFGGLEGVGQYTASFGVVSVPEPVLQGFTANKGPLLIKFTDKGYIGVSNRRRGYSPGREFFKARMTVLMPIFSVLASYR
jgi:hypothetical protein